MGGGGFDPRYSAPTRIGFDDPAPAPTTPSSGLHAGRAWEPTPLTPVARRARASRAPAMLSVLVLVGLGAGGFFGWRVLWAGPEPPAAVRAYLDGGGTTYEPFNLGYAVRLPATPVESSESFTVEGVMLTMQMALIEDDEYEVGVAAMDLGFVVPSEMLDQVFQMSVAGAVSAEPGTELRGQTRTEFDGRPAVDVDLEAPDGYDARAMIIVDGSRVYGLFSHATAANDALFQALRDSLELTGGFVSSAAA